MMLASRNRTLKVLDDRLRIDLQAICGRDLFDLAASLCDIDGADRSLGGLHAEHDILGDVENGDEHEVLVNHSDSGSDGVTGSVEVDNVSVDDDLTLIGRVQAVEDVH